MMPDMGGKPEAMAMPRHSGSAIKNTRNPDNKSLRQFSIRPGIPTLGNSREDEVDMIFLSSQGKPE
jgi:hypothetical protein